jgi:phosphate transport system permease protein
VKVENQKSYIKWRYFKQAIFFGTVRLSVLIITIALIGILTYIFLHGFRAISWDFLTLPPTDSMTAGGIMPAIVGTLYLTIGAISVALPLGVVSAIYLTEYAKQGRWIRIIRIGVNCLAGVPSVVFGLFRPGIFCCFPEIRLQYPFWVPDLGNPDFADDYRRFGRSAEVSASDVPGSLPGSGCLQMEHHLPNCPACGAPRHSDRFDSWSWPRRRGNRADHVYGGGLLYGEPSPNQSLTKSWPCLIISMSWQQPAPHIEQTRPLQYGTVLVLVGLVLGIDLIAILIRSSMRRKKRW